MVQIFTLKAPAEKTQLAVFIRVNSSDAKALGNKAQMSLPRMVGSDESPFCNSAHPGGSLPSQKAQVLFSPLHGDLGLLREPTMNRGPGGGSPHMHSFRNKSLQLAVRDPRAACFLRRGLLSGRRP